MHNTTKYHVLVTGSSSGFGKRMVKTLAQDGHRVFASMRNVESHNKNVARELQDWAKTEGLALEVIELDITSQMSVVRAISTILSRSGQLDVVINNAGVATVGVVEGFTIEQMRNAFDILTFGPMQITKAVLPHMRHRRSGLLIHITSVAARVVCPYLGPYSGAKAALEMLSDHLSFELAPYGIESICVEPGDYATEGLKRNYIGPVDIRVLNGYGELSTKPQDDFETVLETFSNNPSEAPDPQEVAEAIKRLLAMPVGQRPQRTVVGELTTGVDTVNHGAEQGQKEFDESMGIEPLPVAVQQPRTPLPKSSHGNGTVRPKTFEAARMMT